MNEFDSFVDEREKALKRCEQHLSELREMEKIGFMNLQPRLSEVERRIQASIFLANVGATLKIDMDIEDKAKRICELAKAYEEVVR